MFTIRLVTNESLETLEPSQDHEQVLEQVFVNTPAPRWARGYLTEEFAEVGAAAEACAELNTVSDDLQFSSVSDAIRATAGTWTGVVCEGDRLVDDAIGIDNVVVR